MPGPRLRRATIAAACAVAPIVAATAFAWAVPQVAPHGDGRGQASFGDRGLTTFGDRFTESFGTRPLDPIGPIPLASMGGLVDHDRRSEPPRDDSRSSKKQRPFKRHERRWEIAGGRDAEIGAHGSALRSVATLHGSIVEPGEPEFRFVLPALPLPPLTLHHAAAQAELLVALREAAERARVRGDLASAAELLAASQR